MTLQLNTERPETIDIGTNELLGTNPDAIPASMENCSVEENGKRKHSFLGVGWSLQKE